MSVGGVPNARGDVVATTILQKLELSSRHGHEHFNIAVPRTRARGCMMITTLGCCWYIVYVHPRFEVYVFSIPKIYGNAFTDSVTNLLRGSNYGWYAEGAYVVNSE